MPISKLTQSFVCGASLLLLSACSSQSQLVYSGDQNKPEQLAYLQVPANLVLKSINGKNIKVPDLAFGHYEVALDAGQQNIDLNYQANWNQNDESGKIIASKYYRIKHNFSAQQHYQLKLQALNSYQQAQALQNQLNIEVVSKTQPQTSLANAQIKAVAALKSTSTELAQNLSKDYLQQLKIFWQAASQEQQQAFLLWLQSEK